MLGQNGQNFLGISDSTLEAKPGDGKGEEKEGENIEKNGNRSGGAPAAYHPKRSCKEFGEKGGRQK